MKMRQFASLDTLWIRSLVEAPSQFLVVYCFLSPVPMPPLFDKARREMRPGSLLISNSFQITGHPADEIVSVDDLR